METINAIIARCEAFLNEAPRKNWVTVENKNGVRAVLFASDPLKEDEGIAFQFLDDSYCYVLGQDGVIKWTEIGHGTTPVTIPWRKPVVV
jgi:hypothetical protein